MEDGLKNATILVVDDSSSTIDILRRNLEQEGYKILSATDVPGGVQILQRHHIDLVITDLKMPGPSGMQLINYVKTNLTDCEVMMITGHPSIEGAIVAIKEGAEEYLVKPFTREELLNAVQRSLDRLMNRKKINQKLDNISKNLFGLIGKTPQILKACELIDKASKSRATVLICGESGTGKELVARAIHYMSERRSAPFVPVNCVAIPEPLLESELFGHIKGAFTGAHESRAGFFQTADKGTIFLDEIGDTSLTLQARLLRVLQENEICMVGSNKIIKIDVRVVAATNKDLFTLIKNGTFREDLYYRLNVVNIFLPPLRERGDDILLLTKFFSEKYAKEYRKEEIVFSDKVLDVFKNYHWPGNVRELENLIHRLVVISDSNTISLPDLPSYMREKSSFTKSTLKEPDEMTLFDAEIEHINRVLSSVKGNKTKAAKILGIDRKTLRKKLLERTEKNIELN